MSKLSEGIHRLSKEGKSYNEIKQELKCSKGTISYHLGDGQKEKHAKRHLKWVANFPLKKKIMKFCDKKRTYHTNKLQTLNYITILKKKISDYCYNKDTKMSKNLFSLEDLLEKIGNNPKCYLTGRPIDLTKPKTYQLDHIIPSSKGGDDTLGNCNIACRDANRAKVDMFYEDFIQLCKDVVEYEKTKSI